MPPRERLRNGAEYRRVLRRGVRVEGSLLSLVACENGRGYDRLGLAASRRLGGAVTRNRAKRLLRETFRRNKRDGARSVDLVLVPKKDIAERSQGEVDSEYRDLLRRLLARRARTRGAGAPGGD